MFFLFNFMLGRAFVIRQFPRGVIFNLGILFDFFKDFLGLEVLAVQHRLKGSLVNFLILVI